MSGSFDQAPKHVPAWKKLGLKLKNAGEEAEAVGALSNGIFNGMRSNLKRKSPPKTESSETGPTENGLPKKKQKSSTIPGIRSTTSVALSTKNLKPAVEAPTTPPSQRKKAVTFAPETKAEDGDSVKQYYKRWLTSQRSSDPDFDARSLGPALKAVVPASVRTTPDPTYAALASTSSTVNEKSTGPTKKKQKKSKHTLEPSYSLQTPSSNNKDSSSPYIHPALAYLTTYHTSPKAWKFNKAHQNYLLKNIFRLNNVPSQYDRALVPYLKGLSSENTKARIRREALEIRVEDEKWLASSESIQNSTESSGKDDEDKSSEMGVERETPEQHLARRLRDYNAAVDKFRSILEAKEDDRENAEWDLGPARKEWEDRLLRRQRAEVVLWGVGENGEKVMEALQTALKQSQEQERQQQRPLPKPLSRTAEQPAFRTQMGPKRIKFGENDEVNRVESTEGPNISNITIKPQSNGTNNITAPIPPNSSSSTITTTTTTKTAPAKKRKRARKSKTRENAIPDDLTSSSDSDKNGGKSDISDDEETKRVMKRKRYLKERLEAQERELERARREVEEDVFSDDDSSNSSGGGGGSDDGDGSEGTGEGESEGESESGSGSEGEGSK